MRSAGRSCGPQAVDRTATAGVPGHGGFERHLSPLPSARCLRASLSITWDATPVARCARRSAEIAGVSELSASWRVKYQACRMSRPPVLKSRCWRLVSDQLWMVRGNAGRAEDCRGYRRSLPRVAGPRWPESDDRRPSPVGRGLPLLDDPTRTEVLHAHCRAARIGFESARFTTTCRATRCSRTVTTRLWCCECWLRRATGPAPRSPSSIFG